MVYPDGGLVVHGYADDGSLLAFQKGGGVQLIIPPEDIPRFSVVSEMEKTPIYRKTCFCLEGLDDRSFEGWTCGDTWNGWEKPYFDLPTARRILAFLGATAVPIQNGDKSGLKTILGVANAIEEVEWEAELLELPDGGSVKGHNLGGSLIWEEA